MIKKILLFTVSVFTFSMANAQKGTNGIQIGARAAIPTEKLNKIANTGFGGSLKGMYGIGSKSSPHQVTLEAGYNRFSLKDLPAGASGSYSAIPLYTGYRYLFGKVIFDTQVGFSINRIAGESAAGIKASDSQTAFGWAAGVGYLINKVEVGVKYHSSHSDNDTYSIKFVGFRVGYNFAL
ncbi:outer membrane beta-barrel protein [Pedobacter xixiisoli]|uniref:Outer membrane protein beta-barrel domain-containing protein n=1 Tax=Pedobacter xixiisoli TaxID=1476464 RepID=A0A285ZUQ3_9SPHI|nr:outer membrane beta-barrel protein [Pedobacter xixiisoli]SOD13379.1 Outer membrane protein beta-barrel domain-containing protein [Pedobacter xixiisoli]